MKILNYSNQLTVMSEMTLALKTSADTMTNNLIVWNNINGVTYHFSFKNNQIEIFEEDLDLIKESQEIYTVIGIAKVHDIKVNYNNSKI